MSLESQLPPGVLPGSFSESVSLLADTGILPVDSLASYHELCRLRNRLAHEWDGLPSDTQVKDLLTQHAPVLRQVADSLRTRYLS